MGADLYIRSVVDAAKEKYQSLFEKAVEKRDEYMRLHPNAIFDCGFGVSGGEQVDKKLQKLQNEVDKFYKEMYPENGYFRDSYNGSSLFWRIGLSWWSDIKPNAKGCLSLTKLRKIKKIVEELWANRAPLTEDYLKGQFCKVDDSENNVEAWEKFFEDKYKRFIAFIDIALKMKEPIEASL